MAKKYELEWSIKGTKRYYINGTGYEVQIGKYRGADDFEKATKKKLPWHNKWYVDDFHTKAKLFNTHQEAEKYLTQLRNRIYRTKQLK